MKQLINPKKIPVLAWSGVTLLLLVVIYIAYPARSSFRNTPQSSAIVPPDEAARIAAARADLSATKKRQSAWGKSTTPPVSPSPGGAPGALIALMPAAALSRGIGNGIGGQKNVDASLIVMQVGGRTVAMLDGQPIRIGETLATGELVQALGPTFVVLKPVNGELRRIDMKDRFLPRALLVQQKEKTP